MQYTGTIEYKISRIVVRERPDLFQELQNNSYSQVNPKGEFEVVSDAQKMPFSLFRLIYNHEFRNIFFAKGKIFLNQLISDSNSPKALADIILNVFAGPMNLMLSSIFVWTIEQKHQGKISTLEQLQFFTEIYKMPRPENVSLKWTEENQATHLLADCLQRNKHFNLLSAIETELRNGSDYKEIRKITPKAYGLDRSWIYGMKWFDHKTVIAQSILLAYDLLFDDKPIDRVFFQDLIKAPEPVIDEIQNLKNWLIKEFNVKK